MKYLPVLLWYLKPASTIRVQRAGTLLKIYFNNKYENASRECKTLVNMIIKQMSITGQFRAGPIVLKWLVSSHGKAFEAAEDKTACIDHFNSIIAAYLLRGNVKILHSHINLFIDINTRNNKEYSRPPCSAG